MPYPTHRIDLVVLSVEPEFCIPETALRDLQRTWEAAGLVVGDRAGDDASGLVADGFARLWLDQPARMMLYANQQGGFRVTCPGNGENIAAEFGAALVRWRAGAPRSVRCPACGEVHPLEGCVLAPPGAFASSAIVFSDVGGVTLTRRARADLKAAIGAFVVVVRRTL